MNLISILDSLYERALEEPLSQSDVVERLLPTLRTIVSRSSKAASNKDFSTETRMRFTQIRNLATFEIENAEEKNPIDHLSRWPLLRDLMVTVQS